MSYAQNFEDVMLWRALKHVSDGFYVDVGAFSPSFHSVTRAFYERGWHGINIEPNPSLYAKLRAARPRDINLQLAIGETPGCQTLYVFDRVGLSTLSSEVVSLHKGSRHLVTETRVPVETLSNVFSANVPDNQDIHFLKIDVEGFEDKVIRSSDFHNYRPWILVIEATTPMSAKISSLSWEKRLIDSAYTFVYFDGLNRFYVADEKIFLAEAFRVPPNVFDNFITNRESLLKTLWSKMPAWVRNPLYWLFSRIV